MNAKPHSTAAYIAPSLTIVFRPSTPGAFAFGAMLI